MGRYVLYKVDGNGFHIFDLMSAQTAILLYRDIRNIIFSGETIVGMTLKIVKGTGSDGWTEVPMNREKLIYDNKCKEGKKLLKSKGINVKQLP